MWKAICRRIKKLIKKGAHRKLTVTFRKKQHSSIDINQRISTSTFDGDYKSDNEDMLITPQNGKPNISAGFVPKNISIDEDENTNCVCCLTSKKKDHNSKFVEIKTPRTPRTPRTSMKKSNFTFNGIIDGFKNIFSNKIDFFNRFNSERRDRRIVNHFRKKLNGNHEEYLKNEMEILSNETKSEHYVPTFKPFESFGDGFILNNINARKSNTNTNHTNTAALTQYTSNNTTKNDSTYIELEQINNMNPTQLLNDIKKQGFKITTSTLYESDNFSENTDDDDKSFTENVSVHDDSYGEDVGLINDFDNGLPHFVHNANGLKSRIKVNGGGILASNKQKQSPGSNNTKQRRTILHRIKSLEQSESSKNKSNRMRNAGRKSNSLQNLKSPTPTYSFEDKFFMNHFRSRKSEENGEHTGHTTHKSRDKNRTASKSLSPKPKKKKNGIKFNVIEQSHSVRDNLLLINQNNIDSV